MAARDGFDFDPRAIERMFKSLERDVLPTAQAGLLNGLAFGARKALIKHAKETIEGGPTPFTLRAFNVVKVKPTDVDMGASVEVLPQQARFLQYSVNGGIRSAGDPGSSRYDVLVDGDDKNAFGNIRKGFVKRIARKAKAEKIKRARLRSQRDKARTAGRDPSKFSWATKSGGLPGVFFGELNGAKGYWQRAPKGEKPKLLVRFSDSARYKPTLLWDKEINTAVIVQNPSKLYAAELQRAMSKLKK